MERSVSGWHQAIECDEGGMPFTVVGSIVLVLAACDCAEDEMSVFTFLADKGYLARWAMPASNPTWSAASWRVVSH